MQAWSDKLQTDIPWKKIFKSRAIFATSRDSFTFLKLRHRTLYVAKHGVGNKSCRCCNATESMTHLAECAVIRNDFWNPIFDLLEKIGAPGPDHSNRTPFLLVGRMDKEEAASYAQLSVLVIAWRCLYAERTHSRIEDTLCNLKKALKRTIL